ncbi:MAG: CoA-binding protein [Gammaproteobacteria bacterium]|jgi:predicted CoA-binding protein|nr:CoA-binding protein [Gammaproteobacteria bacterium]MDH5171051.1 CoA-binding protein [Gammaproteobacteria bacterium]
MPLTADTDIAGVLARTRTIALLGASDNPARPSHGVMRFLLANGYQVYPVNPALAGRQLLDRLVYPDLGAIPVGIDMVDVFRQAHYLQGIVSEVIAIGAKTLWTQLGVVDIAAAATAERAGVAVVMDRCPAIELPRLQAAGLVRHPLGEAQAQN